MTKNKFYNSLSLLLVFLVPVPGRFAYGIILVILSYILVLCGILLKRLSENLFNEQFHAAIVITALIALCVFFRQLLIIFSPITAFVLGYSVFVPAFTSFMLARLYSRSDKTLKKEIQKSLLRCTHFSVISLLFFLIRDLFGYGFLSFPSPNGIFEIKLFSETSSFFPFTFLTSIPGSIILLAVFFALGSVISERLGNMKAPVTPKPRPMGGEVRSHGDATES